MKPRYIALVLFVIILIGLAFLFRPQINIRDRQVANEFKNPQKESTSSAAPVDTTGLKIEDLVEGTGQEAKKGDLVTIHYKGTLENGTVFDSSYDKGQPFQTPIGQGSVIKGWDEGVPGMKVGGKRRLTIPPQLAYGERGQGSIPPNATLIFELELVEVRSK